MRFEIDTTAKTITIMQECTIQELNELMRKFIGEKEMKEYKITFTPQNLPLFPMRPFINPNPYTDTIPAPYTIPNVPMTPWQPFTWCGSFQELTKPRKHFTLAYTN